MSHAIALFWNSDGPIVDARSKKVLVILIAAMTLGSLLLMSFEGDITAPSATNLSTITSGDLAKNFETSRTWNRVVVHSSTGGSDTLPGQCHFIVDGPTIRMTSRWKAQETGQHVSVAGNDFNSDSVAICLIGDFSKSGPTVAQFESLMKLVQRLQRSCNIRADSVYLQSELNPQRSNPGRAFPVNRFNHELLR